MNKQSNLNGFFDISAGAGTYAPHQKNAYASKRLQKLVTNFRKGKGISAEREGAEAGDSAVSTEASSSNKTTRARKKSAAPRKQVPPVKKRKLAKGVESDGDESMNEETDDESTKLAKELSRPRLQPKRSAKLKQKAVMRGSEGEAENGGSSGEFEPE